MKLTLEFWSLFFFLVVVWGRGGWWFIATNVQIEPILSWLSFHLVTSKSEWINLSIFFVVVSQKKNFPEVIGVHLILIFIVSLRMSILESLSAKMAFVTKYFFFFLDIMFMTINILDHDLTHATYGKNSKQSLVFWIHHMDRILKAILMFGDGPKNFPMVQGVEFEIPNYF